MLLGKGCLQRKTRKDLKNILNIFYRASNGMSIVDRRENKCICICEFYSSFYIWKSSLEWVKCDCLSDDVKAEMSSGYLQPPRRESEELWRLKNIIPTKIFTASLKLISFNNWVLKSWSNNYGCKWKYLFVFNNILIRVESCHLSRCLSIIASMFPRFSVVFKLYSTLEIFILISTCWTPSAVKCMPWDAKSWRVSTI